METAFVFLETSHLVRFITSLPRFWRWLSTSKKSLVSKPQYFPPCATCRALRQWISRQGWKERAEGKCGIHMKILYINIHIPSTTLVRLSIHLERFPAIYCITVYRDMSLPSCNVLGRTNDGKFLLFGCIDKLRLGLYSGCALRVVQCQRLVRLLPNLASWIDRGKTVCVLRGRCVA